MCCPISDSFGVRPDLPDMQFPGPPYMHVRRSARELASVKGVARCRLTGERVGLVSGRVGAPSHCRPRRRARHRRPGPMGVDGDRPPPGRGHRGQVDVHGGRRGMGGRAGLPAEQDPAGADAQFAQVDPERVGIVDVVGCSSNPRSSAGIGLMSAGPVGRRGPAPPCPQPSPAGPVRRRAVRAAGTHRATRPRSRVAGGRRRGRSRRARPGRRS